MKVKVKALTNPDSDSRFLNSFLCATQWYLVTLLFTGSTVTVREMDVAVRFVHNWNEEYWVYVKAIKFSIYLI